MKCREFLHGLDLMAPTEGYVRTPGLHASDIYNDLYRRLMPDLYDKRGEDGTPSPLPEERVGFGTRFEEALEPQLRASKWQGYRPGEFATQHDATCVHQRTKVAVGDPVCPCGAGIIYSPDYIFTTATDTILGEFKLTWYSSREFPHHRKFAKWLTQVKLYLRNLRMDTVWLFPFWVNGGSDHNYREVQPEFKRAYELTFTPRETEKEHQMLVKHARDCGMLEATWSK